MHSCTLKAILVWIGLMANLATAAPNLQETGLLSFQNQYWDSLGASYLPGADSAYLELTDVDLNKHLLSKDSVTIAISSESGDVETITLVEIMANAGVFRGTIAFDLQSSSFLTKLKESYPKGFSSSFPKDSVIVKELHEFSTQNRAPQAINGDGWLQVAAGNTIIAHYHDNLNDWGVQEEIIAEVVYGGWAGYVNGTWTPDNNPYIVVGDIRVGPGYSLTVEAGVRIEFSRDASLRIDRAAELHLAGALGDSVYLVSRYNNPADSQMWGGILRENSYYSSKSPIHIEYAVIEHAQLGISLAAPEEMIAHSRISKCGDPYYYYTDGVLRVSGPYSLTDCMISGNYADGLAIQSGSGFVSNCVVKNNAGDGIVINGGPAILTNVKVSGNTQSGITVSSYSRETMPVMRRCEVFGNSEYDVANYSTNELDMRFCTWDNATTAAINDGPNPKNLANIYDYFDNSYRGIVLYGGCTYCPPAGSGSTISFTTATWDTLGGNYPPTSNHAYVKVVDPDLNSDALAAESVSIDVFAASGDWETIYLGETDTNSGEFRGWITFDTQSNSSDLGTNPLDSDEFKSPEESRSGSASGSQRMNRTRQSAYAPGDGLLQASIGDMIFAAYIDSLNEWGAVETVQDTATYAGWEGYVEGTWTKAGNPYVVVGDLVVGTGYGLTIERGVQLLFMPGTRLIVNSGASLHVKGIQDDSVSFTPYTENPNVDQIWLGIELEVSQYYASRISISHAVITSAKQGVRLYGNGNPIEIVSSRISACGSSSDYYEQQGLYASGPFSLIDCTISANKGDGVNITGNGSGIMKGCSLIENLRNGMRVTGGDIVFEQVKVVGNRQSGVYVSPSYYSDALPIFHHCHFYGNSQADFYNAGESDIDAKYNWWGEATTLDMRSGPNPKDLEKIFDHFDDSYRGIVKYGGWMNFPYLKADYDGNFQIDVSDAVGLIQYIFAGGSAPSPPEVGDCNCDGRTNLTDIVAVINFIFAGGPEPGTACF